MRKKLIEELSIQMTKDFGSGYTERNLEIMRKFSFNIRQTLSAKLSWLHYTKLDETKRYNRIYWALGNIE